MKTSTILQNKAILLHLVSNKDAKDNKELIERISESKHYRTFKELLTMGYELKNLEIINDHIIKISEEKKIFIIDVLEMLNKLDSILSLKYSANISMANGATIKMPEHQDPKNQLRENSFDHLVEIVDEQTCRNCGCTNTDCTQCIEKTGESCYWIEEDLCSACSEN